MSFGAHFIPAAQRPARSDGEDTRVRLLRAALQLFSERGFAQTSVRAIAEAAGTNVAAIAYHFGDKARLYTATFYEPFGSGSDLIPVFADPALTLQQALAAYFGGFLEPLKHDDLVTQSLRLHVRELLDPTHVWPELIERECRAPQLARSGAVDEWVDRLTGYALSMVQGEIARRQAVQQPARRSTSRTSHKESNA